MYDQFKDVTAQDRGFCFLRNPVCFSKFDKPVNKFKENLPPPPFSQAASGRVKSKSSR